ncbi:formate dehydrogenase accessory sulfurtransferase FdhD [Sphingobacteriales bacterium UPWRP_1]|nr:formate dehydrogenase family accessory protein FdhD [Sphingobacteriales bacterium TSM_CSM]PSJ78841.1 formate dehydrogenase accessory sulfurtransferase FdhD [Sphingobacteriales bacterium UPWRP_1]
MQTDAYLGLKYNDHSFSRVTDVLAVEEMLSISINKVPFTITMRTPGAESELVRGLLYSEQIYTDPVTHPVTEVCSFNELGYVTSVNVVIPHEKLQKAFAGKRSLVSVSSCGICGKTELDITPGPQLVSEKELLQPEAVADMFTEMSKHQNAFNISGGCHAAAAFTISGQLLSVQEDIGRHNAVDKVIGSLLLQRRLHLAKCLVVSGRISYEIVSKTYFAGIRYLAAVSAPSTMAVDYCKQTGITLLAFCRNRYFTIYANPAGIDIG